MFFKLNTTHQSFITQCKKVSAFLCVAAARHTKVVQVCLLLETDLSDNVRHKKQQHISKQLIIFGHLQTLVCNKDMYTQTTSLQVSP